MAKMKYKLLVILTIALCLFSAVSLLFCVEANVVNADDKISDESSQREQIETIIFDVAKQDGYSFENVKYSIEDVYFANETWAGYIIDFIADETNGYAIIFYINEHPEIMELVFEKSSPYYGKSGKYIYPSLGNYIIKNGEYYYDACTENKVNYNPDKNDLFYAACNKDKEGVPVTRTVNYSVGGLNVCELPNFFYNYSTELTSHKNNCANAAGLIMLNYWNKYYYNDILKLDVACLKDENVWMNGTNDPRKEYMEIFYKYMKTNWIFGTGGTLPNNGYDGFERLIKEKGYQVSRKTGLSYSEMKSSIKNNIPVFITSTDYYFSTSTTLPSYSSTSGNHTLTMDYERTYGLNNAHTFVGYGYAEYVLLNSNGESINEQLIKVADGWGGTCYFNLNVSNVYSSASITVYK